MAASATVGQSTGSAWLAEYMDLDVDPTKDFWKYCNGAWAASVKIPPDQKGVGGYYDQDKVVAKQLQELFAEMQAADPNELSSDQLRLRSVYVSALQQDVRDKDGIEPIRDLLHTCHNIHSSSDAIAAMATLHRNEVQAFVGWQLDCNAEKPESLVFHLDDAALQLGSKAAYSDEDKCLRLVQYAEALLIAQGWPDKEAADGAAAVLKIEKTLADGLLDPTDKMDPTVTSNLIAQRDLPLCFQSFITAMGITCDPVQVMNPSSLTAIDKILGAGNIEELQAYLTFLTLDSFAPYLSQNFVGLYFDFHQRYLNGITEPKSASEQAIDAAQDELRELVGKAWRDHCYPHYDREKIQYLADYTQQAFIRRVADLPWWADETRPKAEAKAKAVKVHLCFPDDDKWRDYSGLSGLKDDVALGRNIRLARQFNVKTELGKQGTATDRDVWIQTPWKDNFYYQNSPQVNNAYDDFGRLSVFFPLSFLQTPPAQVGEDPAFFGAFAAILGHELFHSVDSTGRHYDSTGKVTDWFTAQDNQEFSKRAALTAAQFSSYTVTFEDGSTEKINGELTLRENLSDLGGLLIAMEAMQQYRKDKALAGRTVTLKNGDVITPEKAFFIAFAQCKRYLTNDKTLRSSVKSNEHAPSWIRTNGTVVQVPAWRQAFGLEPLPDAEQSQLWTLPRDYKMVLDPKDLSGGCAIL